MYNNIQALRGIAAFMVVLFHMLGQFKAMNLSNSWYESIAQFGYIGVDIFFVISGFVMAKTTHNLANNPKNAIKFIQKRLLRIFLGYWPILLFAIIVYALLIPDILAKKDIFSSVFLISTNLQKLVIGPSWSLTYELYFYLLLSLLLMSNFINKKVFLSLLAIIIVLKILFLQQSNQYLDFFLSHFLLEFIIGFFLFYLKKQLLSQYMLPIILLLAITALTIGINLPIADDWTRVVTFGFFGVCIIALAIHLEDNKIFIANGMVKKIGDASYSLYIVHIIFVNLFYHSGLRNYLTGTPYSAIGFVLYLALIIYFSLLIYKYLEHPLYQKMVNRLKDAF
ncbi:MAG TPA: acyltransferase [Oceanospirillales bacterium]|nr:acyltransferase [Oceanospirillales bacterium]